MIRPRSFADLAEAARRAGPVNVAIAGGDDEQVARALVLGFERGLILHAALTGDAGAILARLPDSAQHAVTILPAQSAAQMAALAVAEITSGRADILIKGAVDSGAYLRAVVNRATGIARSAVLSNITIAAIPGLDRLIGATDNGIVPMPDAAQKRAIIGNTAALWQGLGVASPRVALVAATEKVTPAMPATLEAAQITRDGVEGFVVEGPMGYDMAIDPRAAALKGGADSPVAGHADLLVFANIEAANAVVKSWKFHANAQTGSVVLGGQVPILLNSRSDGAQARLNGLLLAILMRAGQRPAH